MSVLVVIPCLNEALHLEGLLTGLLKDGAIDLIVVADGGSEDDSRAIVAEMQRTDARVVLLDNAARIQSAGVNLAVARYGGGMDWLLRVDAHCAYPEGYLPTLLRAAEEHAADAVVVPMRTQGRSGFQLAVAAAQNSVLGTGGSAHRSNSKGRYVDHGHHALIRMDVFCKVGGYCESMPCNEDAELDHRISQAGYRIWLEPTATIGYWPRTSVHALARQYLKYGVGRASTLKRHSLRPRLRQMLPVAVPPAIALVPLGAVHWLFAAPALIWLLVCLLVGAFVGFRAPGGWWAVMAGLAAAVMHASWGLGFWKGCLSSGRAPAPKYGLLQNPKA